MDVVGAGEKGEGDGGAPSVDDNGDGDDAGVGAEGEGGDDDGVAEGAGLPALGGGADGACGGDETGAAAAEASGAAGGGVEEGERVGALEGAWHVDIDTRVRDMASTSMARVVGAMTSYYGQRWMKEATWITQSRRGETKAERVNGIVVLKRNRAARF